MDKIVESLKRVDLYRVSLKLSGLPITLNESMILYLVSKGVDTGYSISKCLEKDPSIITRTTQNLRSKGFIIREKSRLTLTESGVSILKEAKEQAMEVIK